MTSEFSIEPVVVSQVVDQVLVVTINRPASRNAVNGEVAAGIGEALDELDRRSDLAVGIITGAGGTFCAGIDLKAFLRGDRARVEGRGFAGITERSASKPLIAAVEGWALAGGCEIALACDLITSGAGAKFGLPEVQRGLMAGAGGLLRLPARVPQNIAMELALTGDAISAERAAILGLVNKVTQDGDALQAALKLASRIAENAPLAIRATKSIISASGSWSREEALERERAALEPVRTSLDAQEGARAFAEKRRPVWKGQ